MFTIPSHGWFITLLYLHYSENEEVSAAIKLRSLQLQLPGSPGSDYGRSVPIEHARLICRDHVPGEIGWVPTGCDKGITMKLVVVLTLGWPPQNSPRFQYLHSSYPSQLHPKLIKRKKVGSTWFSQPFPSYPSTCAPSGQATWCWWRHPPRQCVQGAPRFPWGKGCPRKIPSGNISNMSGNGKWIMYQIEISDFPFENDGKWWKMDHWKFGDVNIARNLHSVGYSSHLWWHQVTRNLRWNHQSYLQITGIEIHGFSMSMLICRRLFGHLQHISEALLISASHCTRSVYVKM